MERVALARYQVRAHAPGNLIGTKTRPIQYVTRPDGDWFLLCGEDRPDSADAFRVMGVGRLVDSDPSLVEVLDLEPQHEAERSRVGDVWERLRF